MKEIILIYTRNFSQWVNQMLRDNYVKHFPKIWGKGLKDQMGHYTSRGIEIYRYINDHEKLRKYMVNKDIKNRIFKKEIHKQFRRDVDILRKLISKQPKLKDAGKHLKKIEEYFSRIYPFYTLAVFLPGAWREDFIKSHGRQAESVLETVVKSRKYSEGLLNECDLYLRHLVGSKLERLGFSEKYAKILSVEETRKFIDKNQLPNRKVLDCRLKEYVYIDGIINTLDDFEAFLKRRNLKIKSGLILRRGEPLKGTVAYRGDGKGKIVKGIVKTIFHRNEVFSFKRGSILVSNMTAPEYLPAVKKAKAIITDEGGVTCHAAIVAREMEKPCVIGTKIATKVLKDGDLVEVDAEKGVVKKI